MGGNVGPPDAQRCFFCGGWITQGVLGWRHAFTANEYDRHPITPDTI